MPRIGHRRKRARSHEEKRLERQSQAHRQTRQRNECIQSKIEESELEDPVDEDDTRLEDEYADASAFLPGHSSHYARKRWDKGLSQLATRMLRYRPKVRWIARQHDKASYSLEKIGSCTTLDINRREPLLRTACNFQSDYLMTRDPRRLKPLEANDLLAYMKTLKYKPDRISELRDDSRFREYLSDQILYVFNVPRGVEVVFALAATTLLQSEVGDRTQVSRAALQEVLRRIICDERDTGHVLSDKEVVARVNGEIRNAKLSVANLRHYRHRAKKGQKLAVRFPNKSTRKKIYAKE